MSDELIIIDTKNFNVDTNEPNNYKIIDTTTKFIDENYSEKWIKNYFKKPNNIYASK